MNKKEINENIELNNTDQINCETHEELENNQVNQSDETNNNDVFIWWRR